MQYSLVVMVWLCLSGLWGFLGISVGPGIAMMIIAMTIGVLGSLITFIQLLWGGKINVLKTGLLVAIIGLVFIGIIDLDAVFTWPAVILFSAFISTLSFAASFLVSRVIRT